MFSYYLSLSIIIFIYIYISWPFYPYLSTIFYLSLSFYHCISPFSWSMTPAWLSTCTSDGITCLEIFHGMIACCQAQQENRILCILKRFIFKNMSQLSRLKVRVSVISKRTISTNLAFLLLRDGDLPVERWSCRHATLPPSFLEAFWGVEERLLQTCLVISQRVGTSTLAEWNLSW